MSTITVNNVGKAYKQYPTRWSRLAEWVITGSKRRHTLKWVRQDIDFTVKPGQALGIIGINGAGISTLLKMITGTAQLTRSEEHTSEHQSLMRISYAVFSVKKTNTNTTS